jgi:excisionase family DNA binding protein
MHSERKPTPVTIGEILGAIKDAAKNGSIYLEPSRDFTIGAAADLLGCSTKHIYSLISREILDAYKLGNTTRVTGESIDAMRSVRYKPKSSK